MFPKKEGGEEGGDKEKEREEKEGGGEEEYGRMRMMVSQDDVDLKVINRNEDNSDRSNKDDQSNHGNYNSSGKKTTTAINRHRKGSIPDACRQVLALVAK